MSEQNEFLKDLEGDESKVDLFDAPMEPGEAKPEAKENEAEEVPEELKNRRHKRLETKLQAEREANIAMAAKMEAMTEAKKFVEGSQPSEYLKSVERIYGNESPEAVAATELLKGALTGVRKEATEAALEIFRKEQREIVEASRKEEKALDTMLEELEDEYNIDLTSPKAEELRKGFFKRLEKLSPKDSEGNVIHFADHYAVFEDFQSKIQKKPDSRAKDLSARSMVNSSTTDTTKTQMTADERWLKENGIL